MYLGYLSKMLFFFLKYKNGFQSLYKIKNESFDSQKSVAQPVFVHWHYTFN